MYSAQYRQCGACVMWPLHGSKTLCGSEMGMEVGMEIHLMEIESLLVTIECPNTCTAHTFYLCL